MTWQLVSTLRQSRLHRWLDEIIIHRRPRTQESYRSTVLLHIIPYVGHHKLQKLSVEHVQAMVNKLTKSGLGARSVEYAALVLSRMCYAMRPIRWTHSRHQRRREKTRRRNQKRTNKRLWLSATKKPTDHSVGFRIEMPNYGARDRTRTGNHLLGKQVRYHCATLARP